jgi:hypothetical protein
MAPKKNRRKACWNCDSEIDLDIMICPYCASDLSSSAGRRIESVVAPQPERIPQPVYRAPRQEVFRGGEGSLPETSPPHDESAHLTKSFLITLLFFLLGSVSFLFSLALLFLSDGETLTLRWSSSLWPLFVVVALPLLGLGWRSWRHLDLNS